MTDLSTYVVTDTALCGPRGVPAVVAAAVRGGATCVQVRDKTASTRALLGLVEAVVAVAGDVPVLVDDRLDVALAARAQGTRLAGLHVGQSDLPAPLARSLLWPGALLGLSVGTLEQLHEVLGWPDGTVDHLGVGPVLATPTKPDHDVAIGVEGAAAVATASPVPCVAIGGLHAGLAGPLRRAGLAGAAYVSAVCAADDPEAATRTLAQAWRA